MKKRKILKGLNHAELRSLFEELGYSAFRGDQVFEWMYNFNALDFGVMTNLHSDLRELLKNEYIISTLKYGEIFSSDETHTKRYLFRTSDNLNIESVLIESNNRNTLCVSTQIGCPFKCKFCATGLMEFKRNLSAGEILDQYIMVANDLSGQNISNIVYMGMGEPLLNYDNVVKSISILLNEIKNPFGRNRIILSTVGLPQAIRKLADSGLRIKLALSLHSCFDDIRSELMPVNVKYPLREVIAALKYYYEKTLSTITFEYTLLNNINDREQDIKALTKLSRQVKSKVNIIPFNDISHMNSGEVSINLKPTPDNRIIEFIDRLKQSSVNCRLRETQGSDIRAACGQLAYANRNK